MVTSTNGDTELTAPYFPTQTGENTQGLDQSNEECVRKGTHTFQPPQTTWCFTWITNYTQFIPLVH